ncbi:MAG: hypothetical protein C3F02_00355 [Parcubacteria group bacterium]|nr:MAG: hypothetical protein C3F02_00355 [Parcubacteria group bacterium]
MKLIYVINSPLPNRMAHGSHVVQMCGALAKSGAEVTLVLPPKPGKANEDIFSYYDIERNFTVKRLPALAFLPYGFPFRFALAALSFGLFLLIYLLSQPGQVIIYCRGEMALFLKLLPNRFSFFWETHIKPAKIGSYKKVFTRSRGLVVITKYYQTELADKFAVPREKILYFPDAVDLSLFKNVNLTKEQLRRELGLPLDKKIIAYAGKFTTMSQSKGIENILISFKNLRQKYPDIYLLLVGLEPGQVPGMKKLLGETSGYQLVEYVPLAQLAKYELAADILVMNYPDDFHYRYYMSPLKMFEYMATANPIVTTDLPSIRDILNERSAVLVAPDNLASLSQGLESLINNPKLGQDLARQARQDVEKYTWDQRAKAIIGFIKERVANEM